MVNVLPWVGGREDYSRHRPPCRPVPSGAELIQSGSLGALRSQVQAGQHGSVGPSV